MSRIPPPTIAPIEYNDLRIISEYEITIGNPEGDFSVSVQAQRPGTNETVWKTVLYRITYDPKMEGDVQNVHLKSLTLQHHKLVAEDENGDTYYLDPDTGAFIEGSAFKHTVN